MRRGEIRMVDFDPTRGAEANKSRPAVIVSNDEANATAAQIGRGVLTVVPVTSNVERVYPFQVLIPSGAGGLPQDSKAQAEQVRSIDAQRVGRLFGTLPPQLIASLDDALRLHLAL
ncbi:MAG TPA: type II toxin-antitoxin system PemK/MazF family toxin [Solirubrobacteraceae bacterium]|jgi:mRNA interferase MazF|nr:type II toxin-antitoxin system PemK/MazF family toxin [Solirubrobacteraceae bacterium]